MTQTATPAPELLTVAQVAERGPLSYQALRWLLFNRAQNGLDTAVVRVGRRILLDVDAYDRWLLSGRERAEAA
jgi:hypothetical protein